MIGNLKARGQLSAGFFHGARMLPGWTRTEIAGKPADLFHPPRDVVPKFAVLYLHDYDQQTLADSAAYTAELTRHGLACVAPHGGRSWWADRVCPEFDPHVTAERHLLDHVLPWMRTTWRLAPHAVAALGIGAGGQAAVRLGFKYPVTFRVVAGVASAFDYHDWYGRGTALDEMYPSRERARQDTAILHIDPAKYPPHVWFACDPDDDDWHRGNDRLREKLTAFNLPFTADLDTRAGGHTPAYFDTIAEPALRFITEGLRQESRRLM